MTKPKSYWNYRVMMTKTPQKYDLESMDLNNYISYGIHETYYRGDKVIGWTDNPVEIQEESLKDLKKTLKNMLHACKLPILDAITGEEIT